MSTKKTKHFIGFINTHHQAKVVRNTVTGAERWANPRTSTASMVDDLRNGRHALTYDGHSRVVERSADIRLVIG